MVNRAEKEPILKTPFVIAMDGGGTKTSVVVADTKGAELDSFILDSINYNGRKKEKVDDTLSEIFRSISEAGYDKKCCQAICIGCAGISNDVVAGYFKDIIKKSGYAGKWKLAGDHEIALRGAIKEGSGIIIVAGTGSICYGMTEKGITYRSGGYGYLIDDCGGGYDLGREILRQIVRMEDGRGKETVLKKLVFEQQNIKDTRELITFLYSESTKKQDIAGLAPLLTKAVEQKDSVAEAIIHKAGAELADLVFAVQKKMGKEYVTVATAGSVFKKNNDIREAFIKEVKKQYEKDIVIMPEAEPVYGAVKMAVEMLS